MDYCVYLGEVALDEYYSADRWPGAGDKAYIRKAEAIPGGMVANAACVAASYGMPVRFGSLLNHGAVTDLLLQDLEARGIDTSLVVYDDALPDAKTMIFMTGSNHTILIPEAQPTAIDIPEATLEVLKKAKYVYTTPGDMKLLRYGGLTNYALADAIRSEGALLAFDVDVDYMRDGDDERYRHLDIGFFNEFGIESVGAGRSIDETAAHLLSLGMKLVVVTLGEAGCRIYSADGVTAVPARTVEAVDVTGAGDTFCSSFLVAYTEGKSIRESAEFAAAAAAICVSRHGARSGAVGRQAVEEMLRS